MPSSADNRRLYPRVEVDMPGILHVGEERIECVVKDLSSTGAGLFLVSQASVSGPVQLELRSGHLIPAQISWRSGPRCGLKFDSHVVYSSEMPDPQPESDAVEHGWKRRLSAIGLGLIGRRARR